MKIHYFTFWQDVLRPQVPLFWGGNTGLEVIQAGGEVEAPQLRTQLEIFASVPEACLTQLGWRGGGVVQLCSLGETVEVIQTK